MTSLFFWMHVCPPVRICYPLVCLTWYLSVSRSWWPDRRWGLSGGSPGGQSNSESLLSGNSWRNSANWLKRSEVIEMSPLVTTNISNVEASICMFEVWHPLPHNTSFQPQNTIPDVFLWLLSGSKRLAYVRIPSNSILFSLVEDQRGRDCGRVTTLYMKVTIIILKSLMMLTVIIINSTYCSPFWRSLTTPLQSTLKS